MSIRKVLIVAAHPDDEVLGCGGTIARHIAEGDSVSILFLSTGVGSREIGQDPKEESLRKKSKDTALGILGIKNDYQCEFPDNQFDKVCLLEIVKEIEKVISVEKPNLIYTHFGGDLNIDHRVTYQAVVTASRPVPGGSVEEVLSFEILSSTDWTFGEQRFLPNVFIDISLYKENKMMALKAYEQEMRDHPHSRSLVNVNNLMLVRGSAVGVAAAEAFQLVRKIKY